MKQDLQQNALKAYHKIYVNTTMKPMKTKVASYTLYKYLVVNH